MKEVNKMPPKMTLTTVTTNRSANVQNTSMADTIISDNSDGLWFKNMLQQLTVN